MEDKRLLLTVAETATILRVSKTQVRSLIRSGNLVAVDVSAPQALCRRSIRVTVKSVRDFLSERTTVPDSSSRSSRKRSQVKQRY